MDERCKDCVYIENIKDDVEELKNKMDKIDTRLQKVEKSDGVRENQMETFSLLLNQTKESVDKLNTTIINMQLEPVKDSHDTKHQVWIYILCTCIGMIISQIPNIIKIIK